MNIAIASDHAGFKLKEEVKGYLEKTLGCEVEDLGPASDEPVDYPDFAKAVAEKVSAGDAERGVLICGSGIGMCMAANRFKGVRAAVLRELYDAKMSREHNDCNLACLGARTTEFSRAKELLEIWYKTPFEGGRHERRVNKIDLQ